MFEIKAPLFIEEFSNKLPQKDAKVIEKDKQEEVPSLGSEGPKEQQEKQESELTEEKVAERKPLTLIPLDEQVERDTISSKSSHKSDDEEDELKLKKPLKQAPVIKISPLKITIPPSPMNQQPAAPLSRKARTKKLTMKV